MAEHLQILRRVGWALVIIGVLDIGLMIYCIVNWMNYSSSLNVFAVGAGIFLLRGSLGAARAVSWFSAFLLSGVLLSALIVFPWMWPLDYWLLTLGQEPLGFVSSVLFLVAMLLALFWVYRTLRAPPVLAAHAATGHNTGVPKSAFASGCVLAIGLAVLMQLTLKGETAEKAVRLATEQYGAEYRYVISSIHWSGGHVSARLTAFNQKESREVEIEWED
jgi:hypothetical protein